MYIFISYSVHSCEYAMESETDFRFQLGARTAPSDGIMERCNAELNEAHDEYLMIYSFINIETLRTGLLPSLLSPPLPTVAGMFILQCVDGFSAQWETVHAARWMRSNELSRHLSNYTAPHVYAQMAIHSRFESPNLYNVLFHQR